MYALCNQDLSNLIYVLLRSAYHRLDKTIGENLLQKVSSTYLIPKNANRTTLPQELLDLQSADPCVVYSILRSYLIAVHERSFLERGHRSNERH